jgi:hypothetical protein
MGCDSLGRSGRTWWNRRIDEGLDLNAIRGIDREVGYINGRATIRVWQK